MTKEIDEVTKAACTSPVKIIKAASKARTGFSSTDVSHLDAAYGKSSCCRRLSPPDEHLDSGSGRTGQRPRASKSANNEPELLEQGNGQGFISCLL